MTCLMPGATETEFFGRADMMDTNVGTTEKDDPAEVAKTGFKAMMNGEGDVVSGWKNKVQSAVANVTPAPVLAEAASEDGRARFGKGSRRGLKPSLMEIPALQTRRGTSWRVRPAIFGFSPWPVPSQGGA